MGGLTRYSAGFVLVESFRIVLLNCSRPRNWAKLPERTIWPNSDAHDWTNPKKDQPQLPFTQDGPHTEGCTTKFVEGSFSFPGICNGEVQN